MVAMVEVLLIEERRRQRTSSSRLLSDTEFAGARLLFTLLAER